MWPTIIGGLKSLAESWFETRKAKQEAEVSFQKQLANAEASWDIVALRMSQFSLKDEFITIIWYAPLVVAWFNPDKAMEWVTFVSQLPVFYQVGMFGIMSASFGLRWYFKRNGILVSRKNTTNG